MKVTQSGITKFLEGNASKTKVILLYGTEEALMLEQVNVIKNTLKSYEFNGIDATSDDYLLELTNEVLTNSMFGESRILHVHNFRKLDGKKITDLLGKIDENCPHLVVLSHPTTIEATNSIRKLCEATPDFASIGIYAETDANLKETAQKIIASLGMVFEPQAIAMLVQMYHGNGSVLKHELEKLSIYLISEPQTVTVELLAKVLQSDTHANVFDIPSMLMDKNTKSVVEIIDNAQIHDVSPIVIFATIANYVKKMYFIKRALTMPNAESVDILLKKHAIFFQQASTFKKHLGMYNIAQITNIVSKLNTLEVQTRSSSQMAYNSIKNFAVNVCSLHS